MNNNLIEAIETEKCYLFVYECTSCRFHLGLDATFIENVEDIKIQCPSCGSEISTEETKGEEAK